MASITLSQYGKYMELQNVSGSGDPADAPEGGIYLFASGSSDAPNTARLYMQNEGGSVTDVMKTLDIDAFDALGGAGLHQTQDHFVFSDNGTEKKITFSNLQDAVFADVSGDATIAAGGALTIAAQAVENSMLADDAVGADELAADAVVNASVVDGALKADKLDIDGSTDIGADLVDADLMVVDDGASGTNRKSTFTRVKKYIYSAMSGDATASDSGALTIAADAVEGSMLNDNVISGQTELAHADIASADELMISDGGTLKKVGLDSLRDHYFGQVSGDATIADGGALTIGANAVQTGMVHDDVATELAGDGLSASSGVLAVGVDDSSIETNSDALRVKALGITNAMLAADAVDGAKLADDAVDSEHIAANALDSEHYASGSIQTTALADNQVTLAKMAGLASAKFILGDSNGDPAAVTMSGDATMDNAGALTIAADSVENSMLANITRGSVKVGGAADAPTDLDAKTSGQILVGDGTDIASVAVSGDVTLAANGAVTIAADAVEGSMLNDNVISGQTELAHADIASADELMISDGGTLKKVGLDSLRDHYFGQVSGDATIADGGALTIAAQAVENSMLADDAVGADELAADAVVNASVAAGAAIVATKLNFNVDLGGNVQFGTQSDDTVAFAGPIKAGANTIADSGNNAAITLDGSAGFGTLGGFGGGSGISFSAAAGAQFATDLTVNKSDGSMNKDVKFFGDTAGARFEWDGGEDRVKIHNGSAYVLEMGNTAAGYAIDVATGTANVNKIRAAAFVTYSDESLKCDVQTMNTALDTVMSLNGVEFTWNDSGDRDFGFIAQEVQAVLPKAVHVADNGVQGVDYSRLTSVLVEAVKAQQVQIEELKAILKK